MVREDLRLELRRTIQQAKKYDLPVKKEDLQICSNEQPRQVTINVIPFRVRKLQERYFLILFEDTRTPVTPELPETNSQKTARRKQTIAKEVARLQQELAVTKEHLQAIIEEQEASNQDLRAANEEILSSNEELQSTNEELETAKEEIQATNEELNTVNEELFPIEPNQQRFAEFAQ
jgi:two-component system CheB/CheR fusion protein